MGTTIIGILSALGGGLLGTVLSFYLNKRKQNASEFEILIRERKEITEDLNKRLIVLESEISDLRIREREHTERVNNLKNQLQIFESSHADIPLPMWLKDVNGVLIFINNYYEDSFLIPRGFTIADYLGKDDFSVWNEEIANGFVITDKKVMRSKKSVKTIEKIQDSENSFYYAEVLKYPRKYNNKVIGISGLVLRTASTIEELQ